MKQRERERRRKGGRNEGKYQVIKVIEINLIIRNIFKCSKQFESLNQDGFVEIFEY